MTARTTKTRTLGAALRKAREESGLTLREFAKMIRQGQGVLSRWETGERAARPEHVARILTTLGVTGDRYDDLVAMAQRTDDPYWAATDRPELRRHLMALLECEQRATSLVEVSPLLVPGMLQTSAYTRAMMEVEGLHPDEVTKRVSTRESRKQVLRRPDPARFRASIGSSALTNIIGSKAVMVEQLRYLLDVATQSNVEIRVLPSGGGWTPACEGPFYLIEFGDVSPLVFIENRHTAVFLHERRDVEGFRKDANTVFAASLSERNSVGFIAQVIKNMESA